MSKASTMILVTAVALASGAAIAQTSAEDRVSQEREPCERSITRVADMISAPRSDAARAGPRPDDGPNGQHAGGRHDVKQHEAAMNAEARKSENAVTK